MKKQKGLGGRMAAIAVCAAMMVTAVVAMTVPTALEALWAYLGSFAPYAQTIDGVACTDQGIEVEVLSAISDDLEARFYIAVRDVEEDRLSEFLRLDGRLAAGEPKEDPDGDSPGIKVKVMSAEGLAAGGFEFISYDPETKTALFLSRILYLDNARPTEDAELSITGMNTLQGELYESVSCAGVTGDTLASLPAAGYNKVVFSPSAVEGLGYTDTVLPDTQVVLAPGQTPMSLRGTGDVRISSMGFACDGCFHIRLEFAEGMAPALHETSSGLSSMFYADLMAEEDSNDRKHFVCQERLVEDGVDVLFPLVTAENLAEVRSRQARVYGTYMRPGVEIEGRWTAQVSMDYYTSAALDWTGELAGWQIKHATISPLGVTMTCVRPDSSGGLHKTLYAVKADGSTVAAEPSTSGCTNVGALNGGEESWEAFATWRFEEPVDVEDVVSLTLGNEAVPVN